jgi:hypothetical protein
MMSGQTGMLMSLQSLPGRMLGNLASSTIGSGGWLLSYIVLQSLFLVGPSIDRAAAGTPLLQTNLSTPLSLGLVMQIHGAAQRGRKARDWRSSSRIVEPCLFWMVWSRSKIRLVHYSDLALGSRTVSDQRTHHADRLLSVL